MTTTNDTEPTLAGDPDAQQDEADFDINQDYPDAMGMHIDPSDVVSMANAIQAGVPIGKLAEAHEASLATHTWTPGAACPMRSHNRKVGSLTSIYDLKHDDNEIVLPANVTNVNWLARCETHEADFYSPTFAPAWRARNRPWEFCPECNTIFTQRYGKGALNKKAARRGKKVKLVTVATPKPKVSTAAEREAEATAIPGFDGPLVELGTVEIQAQATTQAALQAAQEAQHVDPSVMADPEEAVWNEWSQRLSKQAPKGAVIDWVGDYHYQVNLKDGRTIDLMVHKDVATFRHRDAKGKDHYTDDLPSMLAEIG